MARSQEKLAQSLESLRRIQEAGRVAIRSQDLTRMHREVLLKRGFLQKVMKGWYVSTQPDDQPRNATPWYSAFWEFCADYSNDRFGKDWCLSPEQSIQQHVGNRTVPRQLIIRSPKGGNKPIGLLHGTSIFDFRGNLPDRDAMQTHDRLNVYDLPTALIEVTAHFFSANPIDARASLAAIPNASTLLPKLLEGGRSTIAGRLCGGFRNIGRTEVADEIKRTMKAVGHEVLETDPFEDRVLWDVQQRIVSPHAARLKLMWQSMRGEIIGSFPSEPQLRPNAQDYLRRVEDAYVKDAYHSLSIEGYQVSPRLIEKVRSGEWNPDENEKDRQQRDALAARGYFQAFEVVKTSLASVLDGANAGQIARREHRDWYRELFVPLVVAGLLNAGTLAGYRNSRVYIKGSRHVPASGEAVSDLMPVYFDLLENEPDPGVRVVLGHFVFVYIHPYSDGNGRTARFLMNLMLASGGFPWTIVPVDQRPDYVRSLELASAEQNIVPFAQFLGNLVRRVVSGEDPAALPDA